MDWKGMNVTVKLTVVNRQATVSIIPSASSLVMKALNEPVRDRKKEKDIDVARVMRERSMAKKLAGTVKEILGTCFSIGCTVNGESPRDVQQGIDDGDVEIPEEEKGCVRLKRQNSCRFRRMELITDCVLGLIDV